MPDFPMLQGGNMLESVGESTADSTGVTVTAGGSANTKGANWQEIVASTAIAADTLQVVITSSSSTTVDALMDIAIGAAGSEAILIANIQLSAKGTETGQGYLFPIAIPAGSRLSAKVQSTTASATFEVVITLIGRSFLASRGLGRCTTYGANTGDSGGASLDPGATAHTKPPWVELVASTTNPIKQILIVIGDRANNVMSNCTWLMDIGVGASSAEKIIIPDLFFMAGSTVDTITPAVFGPFPVNISAGTRIAGRAQCSITDATDRLIDVTIYGMD